MNGRYDHAAIAIFVALILDGLDGRVARLTNTESDLVLNMTVCRIWFLLVLLQHLVIYVGLQPSWQARLDQLHLYIVLAQQLDLLDLMLN